MNNFKTGDIVVDTEYNEIFVFNGRRDGYKAATKPAKFRLAKPDERKKLIESGKEIVKL